jgi:hypothetical protein
MSIEWIGGDPNEYHYEYRKNCEKFVFRKNIYTVKRVEVSTHFSNGKDGVSTSCNVSKEDYNKYEAKELWNLYGDMTYAKLNQLGF